MCRGRLRLLRRDDLLWGFTADAHIQAVILGVIPLDLQFGQIVFIQQLGERLDKSHIGVMGVFCHIFLSQSKSIGRCLCP